MAILNWEVVRYSICCLVSSGLRGRMFQYFTALWTRDIRAFAAGKHFGCSTVTPNFGDFFPFVGIFETIFVGWFPFSEFFGSMAVAQETPEPVEEELRLIQSIFGWTDCSNGLGDLLQVCILLRRKPTLHSLRLFFCSFSTPLTVIYWFCLVWGQVGFLHVWSRLAPTDIPLGSTDQVLRNQKLESHGIPSHLTHHYPIILSPWA